MATPQSSSPTPQNASDKGVSSDVQPPSASPVAQGSGAESPIATPNNTVDEAKILQLDQSILENQQGEESLLTSLREASLKEAESLRELLKYDKDDPRSRGEQARDAMLTMELAHQQGVAIEGDVVSVPGRVSLIPYSILLLLLVILTNLTTSIHFKFTSPNFLFTAPVISLYMIGTIFVYHTAYRAQRLGVQIIVLFCTIIFSVLVDWGYADQIIHNEFPALNFVQISVLKSLFGGHFSSYISEYHENKFTFLVIGLVAFNLILILLILHFVFLGRGTRNIKVKNKNTR
jgi:hypothetical protein